MTCSNCNGEGTVVRKAFMVDGIDYPETEIGCFLCDGAGEMCDGCGESVAVCDGGCLDE